MPKTLFHHHRLTTPEVFLVVCIFREPENLDLEQRSRHAKFLPLRAGVRLEGQEIIGDRSPAEIEYDDSVVGHLSSGMDIQRAIRAANQEHPDEALKPGPDDWADLTGRYEYIGEHKGILKRLGMKE